MITNGSARPRLPKHPSENMKVTVISKDMPPSHTNAVSIHPSKRIGWGNNTIVIDNSLGSSAHHEQEKDNDQFTTTSNNASAAGTTSCITTITPNISITGTSNTYDKSGSSYCRDNSNNSTECKADYNNSNNDDTTLNINQNSGIAVIDIDNGPACDDNMTDITCPKDTGSSDLSVLSVPDDSDDEYEDCYENLPKDLEKCSSTENPIDHGYMQGSPNMQRSFSQEEELLGKVSQVVLKDHYVSQDDTKERRPSESQQCRLEGLCISPAPTGRKEQIIIEDDCTSISPENENSLEDSAFQTPLDDGRSFQSNRVAHSCSDELNDSVIEIGNPHSLSTDEEGDNSGAGTRNETKCNLDNKICVQDPNRTASVSATREVVENFPCTEIDFRVKSKERLNKINIGKESDEDRYTNGKKFEDIEVDLPKKKVGHDQQRSVIKGQDEMRTQSEMETQNTVRQPSNMQLGHTSTPAECDEGVKSDSLTKFAMSKKEKKDQRPDSSVLSASEGISVNKKNIHSSPKESSAEKVQENVQCSSDLKRSKMIDLDEIKRELDENYVNILDETIESSDGFGFGPEDINIFDTTDEAKTDTDVADTTKSPKLTSQGGVALHELDKIKLQYNILELRIAISDIRKTKSLTSSVKRKLSSMERIAIKKYLQSMKCGRKEYNAELRSACVAGERRDSSEEEDDIPLQVVKDLMNNEMKEKETGQGSLSNERREIKYCSDDKIQQTKKNKTLKIDRDRVSKPRVAEKHDKEIVAQDDGYAREKISTDSANKPSPAKVTESYEDSVARKLAERNKRLGIPISPVKAVSESSSAESVQKEDTVKRNLDTMTILTPSNNITRPALQRKPSKVINRPARVKLPSKSNPVITSTSTPTVKAVEGNKTKSLNLRPQPTFITTITLEDDDPVQVIRCTSTTTSTLCIPTHPAKRLNPPLAPAELLRDMMVQYDHQLQTTTCTTGYSKNTVTTAGSKTEQLQTKSSLNGTCSSSRVSELRNNGVISLSSIPTPSSSLTNATAKFRQILPEITCQNDSNQAVTVPKSTNTISVGRGGISTILQPPLRSGGGRGPPQYGGPRHPLIRAYGPAAPTLRPPSVDFMHPSRRMSLLSQMSPRSDRSSLSNSCGGTPPSKSPEKSTTRPNHPSRRMSNVLTGNVSKTRSVSLCEGVPTYKPKPLSRQTHPQARILLSPQYAQQTYKPWTSSNILTAPRSGFRDEGGVIGISDSESESSGTDLECLERPSMILHISSDDETSSDFPEHQEDEIIPRQMPVLVDMHSASNKSNPTSSSVTFSNSFPTEVLSSSTSLKGRDVTKDIGVAPPEPIPKTLIIPSDDEDVTGSNNGETEIRPPFVTTKCHQKENLSKPTCVTSSQVNAHREEAKKPKTLVCENKRPLRKRKIDRLTEHFNLLELKVQVINLGPGSVKRMKDACSGKENWREKENLVSGGLPEYDIVRLGVRRSQRLKSTSSRYTFRQFLKKRERYDHNSFESQHKKVKEERRRKRQEEKRKNEISSIRRALLRINARYLNQSRLWIQLNSHANR